MAPNTLRTVSSSHFADSTSLFAEEGFAHRRHSVKGPRRVLIGGEPLRGHAALSFLCRGKDAATFDSIVDSFEATRVAVAQARRRRSAAVLDVTPFVPPL